MERDFLGMGSKNIPVTVKEEATDSSKDSVPMRGSTMQWSYSNKVSAIPQFLSFKSGNDPLSSSSGFASISAADAFDSNQKPYSNIVQKNMNLDKQGGNHFVMKTYSVQQHFDAYQAHRPQQVRVFPVSNQQNQSITASTSSPVLQSHFGSMAQNVVVNSMNSQPLGGVPVMSPVPVHPTPSSIVGTTELRNGPRSSGSRPAQLTIFYGGSVCVYDDISPEKAQAIMLLAGNGTSATHNKTASASTVQLQSPIVRPSSGDSYSGNKARTSPPISGLPSPISLASTSTNEVAITVKPVGALASATNQTEPPKAASSVGPSSSATLIPSVAVPQARKASLARFLEKRKERVMNSSPYNVSSLKSPDYSITVSDGISLSMNAFSSSSQQLALKGGLR